MKKTLILFAIFAFMSCSNDETQLLSEPTSTKNESQTLNREEDDELRNILLLDLGIHENELIQTDLSNYNESNSITPPNTITIYVDCRYFSSHYGYAYGFGHDAQGNNYYWWKNSKGTFCQKVDEVWCF